jgi:hypothetical protein
LFIHAYLDVETTKPYTENFGIQQGLSFGWNNTMPYDEDSFPRRSVNGSGMYEDGITFVGYTEGNDLE